MILVDTGPLVALLDKDDDNHALCVRIASSLPAAPLLTTWPCFTEAMYLLGSVGGVRYQQRLWEVRQAGRLNLIDVDNPTADYMARLMTLYGNVPMDLADASLVAIADMQGIRRLFALDSDFRIYRLRDGSVLDVIT